MRYSCTRVDTRGRGIVGTFRSPIKSPLNEKTAIYFPRRYRPASEHEATLFSTVVNEWKRGKKAVRADRAVEDGGGEAYSNSFKVG